MTVVSLRRWAALALLLTTSACASAPATTDSARISATIAESQQAPDVGMRPPDSPPMPPGTSLSDGLSADDAVAIALWNNPDFLATLTTLDIARADLVQAGLLKNPILSLLFPLGPKQFEATVSWAIDGLWQRPKRVEDARINVEVVASSLIAHGLRLIADARLAYFDALSAERVMLVGQAQAETAGQIAALTSGRLRLGDASELDARMAEIESAKAQAAVAVRRATRDMALVRLRTLLGLPQDTPLSLVGSGAAPTADCGSPETLIRLALAARPDVRAAELQIDAAGARIGLEQSKIYALTASIDMNGQGREGFEAGPGLAFEIPALSQNQGGRARAKAELEQAVRRYAAVRATVVANVHLSLVKLAEARAIADALGDGVTGSLTRQRQQAEGLYEAGEISLLALLDVRQRLNDVAIARVDATLGVARALVALEHAAGQRCPGN